MCHKPSKAYKTTTLARSLSILLTYIFSKSPLFLALVRLLRNCTALASQVRTLVERRFEPLFGLGSKTRQGV